VEEEADLNIPVQHADGRFAAVSAHPIAELLECPAETSSLLNGAAECISLQPGSVAFRQGDDCRGLYLVIAGEFMRKTDRLNTRVTLGSARAGDIIELASALSGTRHTYTLSAIGDGTLLLLPMRALHSAFDQYPPLRMRLLQELAREVSRAYLTCCLTRVMPARRHRSGDGHNETATS
jgi:CRP-like cAMP-binding protein